MAEQSGAGASDAWLAAHTVYRADLRLYTGTGPYRGTAACTVHRGPTSPDRGARGGRFVGCTTYVRTLGKKKEFVKCTANPNMPDILK